MGLPDFQRKSGRKVATLPTFRNETQADGGLNSSREATYISDESNLQEDIDVTEKLHVVCPHCGAVNRVDAARLGQGDRSGKCGKCHQPLFDGHPVEVDEARFRKHLDRDDLPLLVDFWAPWCGPCRMMAPAFAQAAQQLEPRMRLLKVNTEEAQQLGAQLGIRSIPTLMLFQGGREVARMSGALDAGGIVNWVRQHAV